MKNVKWVGLVLFIIAMGCNTSKNSTSWKANNTSAQKYQKILVLALTGESERAVQMNMEIHLAGDLQEAGQHAVSSLQEYGPTAFNNLGEADALCKLQCNGVDAVMTIVLIDKEKENNIIAGNSYAFSNASYADRFWSYRTAVHYRFYQPGYYVNHPKYVWETNLYDLATQTLLYSVQTQSFDAFNAESLGHQYGQMVIRGIVRNKVLSTNDNSTVKAF